MELPMVKQDKQAVKRETVAFRGLDLSGRGGEGTLSDCRNLSARAFPALAPRLSRKAQVYQSPTALFSWDGKPLLVDGERLLCDGQEVARVDPGEKQFAVVNTKLVIWPDMLCLDLESGKTRKLDASAGPEPGTLTRFTDSTITIQNERARVVQEVRGNMQTGVFADSFLTRRCSRISWSEEEGLVLEGEEEVAVVSLAGTFPTGLEQLKVGDLVMLSEGEDYPLNTRTVHIDREEDPQVITYGEYPPVRRDGFYGKVAAKELQVIEHFDNVWFVKEVLTLQIFHAGDPALDLTEVFEQGDRVQITGCVDLPDNNSQKDCFLELAEVRPDTLVFPAGAFTPGEERGAFTVSRPIPALDFICECENRLWGVSNQDNTVYASALGDPGNFHTYAGLSTDSYAVAVGGEGDFTALCKYGTGVLCWKERTLHKVLGRYPAEYQLASYQYAGVQAGSHKSLVNLNERLFYLGRDGVYVYSGGAPDRISQSFGETVFRAGRAGTDGLRYYLSALDGMGKPHLLVYDLAAGLWLREDDTRAVDFCRVEDRLLCLTGERLLTLNRGVEQVEWYATLSPFLVGGPEQGRVLRLFLRLEVPQGAWIRVRLRCDQGTWMDCGRIVGGGAGAYTIPIRPNRCHRFEIRIEGRGDCRVESLMRETR